MVFRSKTVQGNQSWVLLFVFPFQVPARNFQVCWSAVGDGGEFQVSGASTVRHASFFMIAWQYQYQHINLAQNSILLPSCRNEVCVRKAHQPISSFATARLCCSNGRLLNHQSSIVHREFASSRHTKSMISPSFAQGARRQHAIAWNLS
ncbi:hypothetical protein BDW66DRAFT_43810 [Aspergillus desertorum]